MMSCKYSRADVCTVRYLLAWRLLYDDQKLGTTDGCKVWYLKNHSAVNASLSTGEGRGLRQRLFLCIRHTDDDCVSIMNASAFTHSTWCTFHWVCVLGDCKNVHLNECAFLVIVITCACKSMCVLAISITCNRVHQTLCWECWCLRRPVRRTRPRATAPRSLVTRAISQLCEVWLVITQTYSFGPHIIWSRLQMQSRDAYANRFVHL